MFYIFSWIIMLNSPGMQTHIFLQVTCLLYSAALYLENHSWWELADHEKIQSIWDILSSEVGIWGKTVENPCQTKSAYAESTLCQQTLDTSKMPAVYFKLPLIKQSEIQSHLKKGLTLACSDHTSVLCSTEVTVKASGHFQDVRHTGAHSSCTGGH